MGLAVIQRFPSEYIWRLKQIGLVFFEKIATNEAIAGETQDFYQGLLVGFDRAVKLIDEEDGVQALGLLKAKIAKFIDNDFSQLAASSEAGISEDKLSISRLSPSYITQLQQSDADTEDEICPTETQDFYHGCIAALDFAVSLAGEKYAYAQISLLKTNAAYFIDLNKDQARQVHIPELKSSVSVSREDLRQNSGLIGNWIQLQPETSVDDTDSSIIEEEILEPENSVGIENILINHNLKESQPNILEDDSRDSNSSTSIDIEQIKLAESILPIAQKAFEYVLNHFPERVEETNEYTRARVGNLYDLMIKEFEGISISSLTASRRGELIRVQGEELIVAQGILSEDVEFWTTIAQQLDEVPQKQSIVSEKPDLEI
ncbi:hypothetical protein ACE1CI_19730 [Aerosakkonemataceae cyanobacterium BLCC-F50]|uniref:Uncharacterized protein n=1 Tax=Floridaenema flaviceps BLCC-F50 TaxID=3153642 RepID=A0ABV4XW54_9CYAN